MALTGVRAIARLRPRAAPRKRPSSRLCGAVPCRTTFRQGVTRTLRTAGGCSGPDFGLRVGAGSCSVSDVPLARAATQTADAASAGARADVCATHHWFAWAASTRSPPRRQRLRARRRTRAPAAATPSISVRRRSRSKRRSSVATWRPTGCPQGDRFRSLCIYAKSSRWSSINGMHRLPLSRAPSDPAERTRRSPDVATRLPASSSRCCAARTTGCPTRVALAFARVVAGSHRGGRHGLGHLGNAAFPRPLPEVVVIQI